MTSSFSTFRGWGGDRVERVAGGEVEDAVGEDRGAVGGDTELVVGDHVPFPGEREDEDVAVLVGDIGLVVGDQWGGVDGGPGVVNPETLAGGGVEAVDVAGVI